MQVIWKVLFKHSSRDYGTLGHLFSVLGRLPAAKDPKKDVTACREALLTVLAGYFVAAGCSELGIVHPDDEVDSVKAMKKASPEVKKAFIDDLATKVVEKCSIVGESLTGKDIPKAEDGKYNYSRVLCHYGSLVLEFTDAWAEGDGERLVRCWRIFLPHFYSNGRTKYSVEAIRLLFQLIHLPPDMRHQLVWNRTVSTHGGLGRNIPCDLHKEHVNKLLKDIIVNMGPNLTDKALHRSAKSVSILGTIAAQFDLQSGVPVGTSAHSTCSDEADVSRVVSVVQSNSLLTVNIGRIHIAFPKINSIPWQSWIGRNLQPGLMRKRNKPLNVGH